MSYNIEDLDLTPLPLHNDEWEKGVSYLFRGLGIVIEYLAGDVRNKVKGNGVVVSGVMPTAYGYILRTTDVHGEEIDMYLASTMPDAESPIYVIDQVDPATGYFDEHKVMLGFSNSDEATAIYYEAFSDGSGEKRLGAITTFPGDTFQSWIGTEGYSLQPASKYELDGVTSEMLADINQPPMPPAAQPKPIDEAGGVIISLPDLSKGPKLTTCPGDNGLKYLLHLFSPLMVSTWTNTIDTFCRTLDLASENDEVHIFIECPGGDVFLMGRIVSAMLTTKAKVFTYAQGCIASAAMTIWSWGQQRQILPGAYFMQHMSSQQLGGKTTDIAALSTFCMNYIIDKTLDRLVEIGLFTADEVADMVEKSADIYLSGREAIRRVGNISGDAYVG